MSLEFRYPAPPATVTASASLAQIAFGLKPYWPIATVKYVLQVVKIFDFRRLGRCGRRGRIGRRRLGAVATAVGDRQPAVSESGIEAILVKFPPGFKAT